MAAWRLVSYGEIGGWYNELGVGIRESRMTWTTTDFYGKQSHESRHLESLELALATGLAIKVGDHGRLIAPLLRLSFPQPIGGGPAPVQSDGVAVVCWLGTELRFELSLSRPQP